MEPIVAGDPFAPRVTGRRREIAVDHLTLERVTRAKRSFATRRVVFHGSETLLYGAVRPRAGDLLLARVDRLGQHGKLESPEGRRAWLHVGDEIIVAYADRYAPDQFEARVPPRLRRPTWSRPVASRRRCCLAVAMSGVRPTSRRSA